MPNKEVYEFAIIRIMPKVERGECINVGIIVFSKQKKYLGIKYIVDHDRLKAFSKDIDLEDISSYLEAWKLISDGNQNGGLIAGLDQPERFRWLTASKSTILQCSKVHPGLTSDPEAVLQDLFVKYVS